MQILYKKNLLKRKNIKTQELSKYNKREQKLITRIYSKIKELLPKRYGRRFN